MTTSKKRMIGYAAWGVSSVAALVAVGFLISANWTTGREVYDRRS